MKEHLQPWYDGWLKDHVDTDLIYAGPTGDPRLKQVHFVRDELPRLFWSDVPYDKRNPASPRDDCKETAYVIGEHHSKSVRLPVYLLERQDSGLQIVLRYNFHDWNVSVVSETPIDVDLHGFQLDYSSDEERKRFPNGYTPGRGSWGYCFFQGFPEEFKFGPYRENPRKFSLCITNDYELYAFVRLLMNDRRKTGAAGRTLFFEIKSQPPGNRPLDPGWYYWKKDFLNWCGPYPDEASARRFAEQEHGKQ